MVDQDLATTEEAAPTEEEHNSTFKKIPMVKKVSNQVQDLETEVPLCQRIVSRRWITRVPTKICQSPRESFLRETKAEPEMA